MSDMPSARQHALYDLRRKRAGILTGLVFGVSIVALFLIGGIALAAVVIAALLVLIAVPSWVGVEPRYPIPTLWRELLGHLAAVAVPAVGLLLLYTMWSKGRLEQLSAAPILVVAAAVYAICRWHHLAGALARVRGAGAGMPFLDRLWRHYLGYAAGLAVGVAAASVGDLRQWMLSATLFAGSLLIVKMMVDVALPQPPLAPRRLSATFLILALMSPVWFGLPWGVALAVLSVLFDLSNGVSFASAVDNSAMVVIFVAVATLVVFLVLATAATVVELATGEG